MADEVPSSVPGRLEYLNYFSLSVNNQSILGVCVCVCVCVSLCVDKVMEDNFTSFLELRIA